MDEPASAPECDAIREAALEVNSLAGDMREAALRLRGLPEVRRWNEIAALGPSILAAIEALSDLYDYLAAGSADARARLGREHSAR